MLVGKELPDESLLIRLERGLTQCAETVGKGIALLADAVFDRQDAHAAPPFLMVAYPFAMISALPRSTSVRVHPVLQDLFGDILGTTLGLSRSPSSDHRHRKPGS